MKSIIDIYKFFCIISFAMFFSCKNVTNGERQFNQLSHKKTAIEFKNKLTETDSLNYFTYSYLYMGGGVAVGDINNDGLDDLFFTGNQVSNKLYINKGNLEFEDITDKAGVNGSDKWYTGVTIADVNNDGFLDIYTCVAGKSGNKKNELYINNKNNTFTESAEKYGLANVGNSVQATFFDYDKDGDLDVYVANYPPTSFNASNTYYRFKMRDVSDVDSDKLYRNDGGKFVDVSVQAGVASFGLSLSATVADLNNDNWPDIYVSNDFSTPDYLYMNNQDGTFTEQIKKATKQTSFYGMGVDIADYNNDGLLDILQVDMSAQNNRRSKANMASMNPALFWGTVNAGFGYQYMQNSLQLNRGNVQKDTAIPHFSNTSRLAGISSTDWSWGPLFADFDNDGWKDIFISNGTRREINNRDYFAKLSKSKNKKDSLLQKAMAIPSEKIENFILKNNTDLSFSKMNKEWGVTYSGFSNGCAYSDLDNDGDLDIVVNNIDDYASVFENKNKEQNNFLSISFKGIVKNEYGIGTRVTIVTDSIKQVGELTQTRGFQSAVAPKLHFGVAKAERIDSLVIDWPNGKQEIRTHLKINQHLQISYSESNTSDKKEITSNSLSKAFTSFSKDTILIHKHTENRFNDFKFQVLLPHKLSNLGPALAVADVNGDGKDDLFVGGAKDFSGSLYIQGVKGFKKNQESLWEKEKKYEDIKATFTDFDNDGDQDLYVVSGGYEFSPKSEFLKDRIYRNDGGGSFTKLTEALPDFLISGGAVAVADYDKDNDVDVFVGGRLIPGNYPTAASSFLLKNESSSNKIGFEKDKKSIFNDIGMVTGAEWFDYNNDTWLDLVVVGEWMTPQIFKNNHGKLENVTNDLGLDNFHGWWNTVKAADFDNDGDLDFVVGNLGLNYKYKASEEKTFDMYVNDFDKNKQNDIVLSYYNEGKQYPVRGRECSSQQIPTIKRKFKNYDSFSKATVLDVYGEKNIENSTHYKAETFAHTYFENVSGKFKPHLLPKLSQLSSINQILIDDYTNDGFLDILTVGNLHEAEVETPRNDASIGLLLANNKKGNFDVVNSRQSGFYASGNIKGATEIKIKGEKYIIVAKNNDYLQFIKRN
uniref:FG-GAP-like repeat-containing protein n=1 Tax=Aquimarina agarilytica TaxID=1087449 RepID=UPI001E2BE1ED|nr:FG-GAP-like repeat-containing protein [Aquimarina agarilytica]